MAENFTQEEIEYAERHLKAEIQKLERAIERKKNFKRHPLQRLLKNCRGL